MAGIELLTRSLHPANAYEETLQHLLQAIRLGLLEPGSKLPPERQLATILKVSRDTIRDVLGTLAQSGLVVSHRGRYGGTFIVEDLPTHTRQLPDEKQYLDAAEIEDVTVLRRVLEIGAAREAANRDLSAKERKLLATAYEDCAGVVDYGYRRLDSRFHLTVAELAGSPTLVPLAADVRTRMNALLDQIPLLVPNLSHSNEQHQAIVTAILSGRPDAAAAAMGEHIDGSAALLRGFLSDQ